MNSPERSVFIAQFTSDKEINRFILLVLGQVKQRWSGRPIAELFASEFRQRPKTYYVSPNLRGKCQLEHVRFHPLEDVLMPNSLRRSPRIHGVQLSPMESWFCNDGHLNMLCNLCCFAGRRMPFAREGSK